ncbi:MAG: xylulokinase [Candidatus Promineifilaceae bacterium]|jgi:xylulokinase
MNFLLGIDLGTSSVKAALFEADSLRLLATADREYPVLYPQPGYAEQDPDAWWGAVIAVVRDVLDGRNPHHIQAIGLDGQMHGLVCLDANLRPIHPAIIWADARASGEIKQLAVLRKTVSATLPGPPAAGFAATSALWLSHHQPLLLEQTRVVLLPKDFLRLQLTGLLSADPSDAAGTWLFDIKRGAWAPEVAAYCGLRPDQLPPIMPSAQIAGELTEPAAKALGLPSGIPVITGCADLPAQALGHGVVDPGVTLVTVGTGGQAISPLAAIPPDSAAGLYVFQHAVPERWYIQAAILSAGLSLRWLRDLIGLKEQTGAYEKMSDLASAMPPGAEGLLFLPHLAGERTPYMDAQASGLFLGLRLHHQAGHLVRAIMEGVGFALKQCLELVAPEENDLILSGGVTQSAIWCRILVDIWARPIEIVSAGVPRACLGAAILAGLGTGLFDNYSEALQARAEPLTLLEPQNPQKYTGHYEQYLRLYPLLKEEMHRLTAN